MGITGKIIFGFLAGVTLLFLIMATFLQSSQNEFNEFQIQQDSGYVGSGSIYKSDIGLLDTIFSSIPEENITYNQEEGKEKVLLKSGEYFLDIRDVQKSYIFQDEYFEIAPIGLGRIYINTTNPKKYTIISFNGTVLLHLKNGESDDILSQVYLYPHMSIDFDPTKNTSLRQSDLIRISSVFDLGYIQFSLYHEISRLENASEFLTGVVEYLLIQNSIHQRNLSDIYSFEVWAFPGSKYIERYFSLLVNDEKKKIYYKNRALDSILDLVHTSTVNSILVQSAYDDIQALSDFPEEYKNIRDVYDFIFSTLSYSYDQKDIYAKVNLSQLYNKLESLEQNNSGGYLSSYMLDVLYSQYDYENEYSYHTLHLFLQTYLKELGIDIDQTLDLSESDLGYLEYFSFFIENILLGSFDSDVGVNLMVQGNLENILKVMQQYISLNDIVYSNKGGSKSISLIYRYIDVLKGLEIFTSKTFFEPQRTKDNLLVKRDQNVMNQRVLNLFSDNTNEILDFYVSKKDFLDMSKQRDQFLQKEYAKMLAIFPEYFSALESYESYVFNYDVDKKNLLDLQTFSDTKDEILSREKFLQYMSQFKLLSIGGVQLEIVDEFYYKASGIFIEGKELSFDLYPFMDNTIDNIKLNQVSINSSYKLDNIQFTWEENFKSARGNDKELYDFSLFFRNTFFKTDISNPDIFVVDKTSTEEDTVIVVFKRDRLLGGKGEFSPLKQILNIEYEDLKVVPGKSGYDISMKDVYFTIAGVNDQSRPINITAMLSADYILTVDTHQFRKVSLLPFVEKNKTTTYPFGENSISFIGSIDLPDFKETMQEFSGSYSALMYLYNILNRELGVEDVSIKYALYNGKTTIKFDYNGEKNIIELFKDSSIEFEHDGKNLSQESTSYKEFGKFISQIK